VHSLNRRVLYRLAASNRLQTLIGGNQILERLARRSATRYFAGETVEEALSTIQRLHDEGFATSLDFFGEAKTDPADVETTVGEYMRLLRLLSDLARDVNVWVDLSNLGLDISPTYCRQQIERILSGLPERSQLQIRAHNSQRTDRILDLVLTLAAQGARVVPTIQANLRRSATDAERLAEARVDVLLVKGAHPESQNVAYPPGEQTDVAFIRLAHQLHARGTKVAIGTHDPLIREALLETLDGVGVEMLLGIRATDAHDLVRRRHRVRIYVPYGRDWLRYWLRRLATSPRLAPALRPHP
jgi:proline dehydrogenase